MATPDVTFSSFEKSISKQILQESSLEISQCQWEILSENKLTPSKGTHLGLWNINLAEEFVIQIGLLGAKTVHHFGSQNETVTFHHTIIG